MRTPRSVLVAGTVLVALAVVVPTAGATATVAGPDAPATDGPGRPATTADGPGGPLTADGPADATNGPAVSNDDCAPLAVGTREDPARDRLGWEDGCWYDERIDVTRSDGLNRTELAAVVARSMARVERIRRLEFRNRTPVEVVSRESFADSTADRYEDVTAAERLHGNVTFEALFMVNESTDALAVQRRNRASGTLGYYHPGDDVIVIVSENTTAPGMDEITLSQELFHSLQYHRFDAGSWTAATEEDRNADSGIIEGDGNYVDYLYERRCGDEWRCLEPPGRPDVGDRHVGLLALQLQPYSDGPVFVRELRREGGWEAVDRVYENPPESTEQTIHTDRYRSDSPTNVTVVHAASDGWHVLENPRGVDYAEFGEAGMYAMLWYPAFETHPGPDRREVIPRDDWFATGSDLDLYDYDHRYTDGWDGDRLYPYVNGTSNRTGETGYVWKSVWDSPAEAREFVDGYTALLSEFDATPVGGRANTYRIDGEFGDAFYVNRTGDTVVIVNAPDVAALSDVRRGAAPGVEATPARTPTPSPGPAADAEEATTTRPAASAPSAETGPTASGTTRATAGADGSTPTPVGGATDGASGPGPGAAGTLVAVALGLAALARGRRSR